MARKRKVGASHVGGQQLPLLTPDSDWSPPTELPDLRKHARVALDLETRDLGLAAGRGPSWPMRQGHVCGFGVAWRGGEAYYPLRHPDTADQFEPDQVKRWLADHWKAGVRFAFQNAPYDLGWIRADLGLPPPDGALIDDTTAMATIVDENRLSYDLNSLCEWMGVPGKDETLLREAATAYDVDPKAGMWQLPARFVGPYGGQDPRATLDLADALDKRIDEEGTRAAYRLECDLIPMTHEMRWRGIRVDLDAAERARDDLFRRRDEVLRELTDKLNHRVGMAEIRSNAFMCRAHDEHKIRYPRTPTGMGSFSKSWMAKHEHWLPRLACKAEQLENAAHKFLQGFILDFAHNGRIHASINQFRSDDGGTRSHRFSYSDPPLQQMPSRDEELFELIRGAFLAERGEWWLAADYSQQEYRLIVHFAELLKCTRAHEAGDKYRDDPRTDFHSMVAEMTGLERKPAKDSNFAKAFGAGVKKFASMIGKSEDEAKEIYDQYDEKMPFVSELAQRCQNLADRRGWIRLIDGARSHFDLWEPRDRNLHFDEFGKYLGARGLDAAKKVERWQGARLRRAYTHKAMNRLIQGSAARQTKMAMRECWRDGLVPLIQMHDELGFSVSSEKQVTRVVEIMRDVVKLTVPMQVDPEVGLTWGLAKHAWKDRNKKRKAA